jgi:spermidine synthase
MISLKLFQRDFFTKLMNYHMKPHSFVLMQYGLMEEKIDEIFDPDVFTRIPHPKSANLFKTRVFMAYTPEYIGHTVFYDLRVDYDHSLFVPISTPVDDFSVSKNMLNRTFGEHFTSIKKDLFPKKNFFTVSMEGVNFQKIGDQDSFVDKIKKILAFNNADVERYDYKFNGTDFHSKFDFDGPNDIEFKTLNSSVVGFDFNIIQSDVNFFNTLQMIVHLFEPKEYQVTYEYLPKEEQQKFTNFTKGDLVAYENGEYTFIHGAKVIDWVDTKYQKVLIFETEKLGKGLMLDQSIQLVKNSKNYGDFFYSKINEIKPKKILIIGGGDLSILERISKSKLMKNIKKIKMIEIDKQFFKLSKKHLHPDFDQWFDEIKTQIIHTDANKYILDLPDDTYEYYDLVIMDNPDTVDNHGNQFKVDFFIKLNQYHLSPNAKIISHSGHVTEDGYLPEHKLKLPSFLGIFERKTESVFVPELTGHLVFYVLSKK